MAIPAFLPSSFLPRLELWLRLADSHLTMAPIARRHGGAVRPRIENGCPPAALT